MTSPQPHRPLVTIGIPTFDRPQLLAKAIDCARKQTYRNLEILVSDDAGPPAMGEVARAAAAEDPRVVYRRQETNLGPELNPKYVLDHAHGKYVMSLADDDYLDPTFIEKAIGYLEAHADAVLCFCDYDFVDEAGRPLDAWTLHNLYPDVDWKKARLDLFRYPYSRSSVAICGLMRTAVVREVGHPASNTFRRILSGHEAPFLARLAARGRIVALPERLFRYMEHVNTRQSLAYTVAKGLRPWELVLLYATIEAKLLATALTARLPLRERLELVRATLGAAARKASRGRWRGNPRFALLSAQSQA